MGTDANAKDEEEDDGAAGSELFKALEEQKDAEFFGTADSAGAAGAEMSEEKKAEIQRLKEEMKQQKEESKEEAVNAENFKVMVNELTRRRTLQRRQTEIFKEEKHDELWTPNELTPVQEEVEIKQDFAPSSF